jgi:AcrR family transcriptional regulator
MRSKGPIHQNGEERSARILTAALEVFSKSSFGDATTDEIARRAHVSKRDIYAEFPDKHAILAAVVKMVLRTGNENLQRVVADSCETVKSLEKRLDIVGLALMNEILSPVTGFVFRLVSSESLAKPSIGALHFDYWYTRRNQLVERVFSSQMGDGKRKPGGRFDANLAARQYVALVAQLPQFSASLGMRDMWNPKSIESHVSNAVKSFLRAYPSLV